MKKLLFAVLLVLTANFAFAQAGSLLAWNVSVKKIADSTYQLKASATVPAGWYLYAASASVEALRETVIVSYDYENAQNTRAVTLTGSSPNQVADAVTENKQSAVFTGAVEITQEFAIAGTLPAELKGIITAYLGRKDEFTPAENAFSVKLEGGAAVAENSKRIILENADVKHPLSNCGHGTAAESSSFLTIFLLGFAGGLVALITPCVFPMIPATVTFFTKRSGSRNQAIKNGILYGFFILLIYTLASLPFHLLGNVQPEIFNNISTNVWLNILFFIIFIVFALSFFGLFDISLPSSIAGKADSKGGLTSIGGIFFMALTLVIVSFSCTGPILGSLLVGSISGGAWELTSGLAGFGLALAFPFAFLAIFPGLSDKLRQSSGSWLDTVKKVLAFIELALALKFLSNADLVMHWGLLKREVFIGLWIAIGLGLTLYLFGVIRLPHDWKGMVISKGRKIAGVLALFFTLYLIPGVTSSEYANLKLLSGFPPPLSYSIYGKDNVHNKGVEANVTNDYEKALQLSKAQHKPLMIDFTGWACVNCRKMEENVWTQPAIKAYIQNNFILVSLYVDDRAKLPVDQRFTYSSKSGDKQIETIGDKWSTFQSENFGQSTQPLYVMLDGNEKVLNPPVGYTPDTNEYLKWLQCAKETFDKNE